MKHCIPRAALSALLALALCAGPLTVPALAEEASPAPAATPAAAGEAAAETTPAPTPTATPLMAVYKEAAVLTEELPSPGPDAGQPETSAAPVLPTEPPVEAVPTPEPTPYNGTGVYVVAAAVTDPAGGEIPTIEWGDRVNVVLSVLDHSSAQYDIAPEQISARVNSSTFTFTGNGRDRPAGRGRGRQRPLLQL